MIIMPASFNQRVTKKQTRNDQFTFFFLILGESEKFHEIHGTQ